MLPFEGPALVVGAGATTLGGGLMIGGGIATTIGQRRALDALEEEGRPVSRVAKRVGDGMFFGGLATAALGGIILAAEQGDFGAELLIPIVGGVSMVGAMIPWEIQQARIIRGARGGVTLAPTVNGVIGTF